MKSKINDKKETVNEWRLEIPDPPASITLDKPPDQWGNITVINDNYEEKIWAPRGPTVKGKPAPPMYDTGEVRPSRWVLQCRCGYTLMAWKHDWTKAELKKRVLDCGRTECTYAKARMDREEGAGDPGSGALGPNPVPSVSPGPGRPPKPMDERVVVKSVSITQSLEQEVQDYAATRCFNYSRAIRALIELGLEALAAKGREKQERGME